MFRKCHREKHRKNQNNMDFWGYWNHTGLEVKFNHLTLLKIIDFHGTEEELSFVAFMLNNSPMIQEIHVTFSIYLMGMQLNLEKRLLQMFEQSNTSQSVPSFLFFEHQASSIKHQAPS